MLNCFITQAKKSIPIILVTVAEYPQWLKKQNSLTQNWLQANGFRIEPGCTSLIPTATGELEKVICCISDHKNFWAVGSLSLNLPDDIYHFENNSLAKNSIDYSQFAIAWGLGAYQFTRYLKPKRKPAQLVVKENFDFILNTTESIYFVRDLINVPTEEMGPTELGDAATQMSKELKLQCKQIIGDELLKQNYPLIHAVGRASNDAPRLIDLRWGNKKHPKITLVGKGVCFDSGGLDIKSANTMLLMKKDMAGGAHVLGLARMIIQAKLPVCLRVLVPVVENAISGNAYRPGDILRSRKGLTIEIGNTDAEGRVILADALTEAVTENPDLLIDITTLTGAARIALGTELPAMFSNQDHLADEVFKHANQQQDFVWRMPLFSLYRDALNTPFADINNATQDGYAGAITAALFLKEFVPDNIPWLHFDMMAWNLKPRPGRPQGGEAMALRCLFSYLRSRYAISL